MQKIDQLNVYFDGACHLCSKEIDSYKKKDLKGSIKFIDISDTNFDAEAEGLDPVEVNNYFHVKTKEGQIVKGVEAFVLIWKELEIFELLGKFCTSSVGSPIVKFAYVVFAQYVRPILPKKKCETDNCRI